MHMIRWMVWAVVSMMGILGASARAQSPFQGHWVGDWQGGGYKGRIYATIDANGGTTGVVINSTLGDWGDLDGQVQSTGQLSARVDYQRAATQTLSGAATLTRQSLRLSTTQASNGEVFRSTLKVDPTGGVGGAPRGTPGTWGGTWKGTGEIGNQQVTVDASGSVEGFVHNLTHNLRGPITGRVTPQGDFYGLVDYPGRAADPFVSKLKASGGKMSGSFVQLLSAVFKGTYSFRAGALPDQQDVARLAGNWSGTWSGGSDRGALAVGVNALGDVSGTITNRALRLSGTLTASLDGGGSFVGVVRYPGYAPIRVTGFMEAYGANLVGVFDDGDTAGRFDLRRRR
ncbi:MAG: hypothetical protein ACOYN0_08185 [Phycisphaerales bacterium]